MLADGDAKVLAGGQSLVPILSMRLASPAALVDINHVAGPGRDRGRRRRGRGSARWPGTGRSSRTERVRARTRCCVGRCSHVAHPTIRNRGTTVGSLVHADPAAEMPAVLVLLGGCGRGAQRRAAAGGRSRRPTFFVGPMESALEPTSWPSRRPSRIRPQRSGTAWLELSRRHGDYAMVGVGAVVTLGEGELGRPRGSR